MSSGRTTTATRSRDDSHVHETSAREHRGPARLLSRPRLDRIGAPEVADPRNPWIGICAVTVLAALLRLPTLGLQSYDFDEGGTLYVIHGSFTHMLHGVAQHESTPPVYYVLAWTWAQGLGTGETGLRLLSALAGVATVPVAYAAGRTLTSHRIGVAAAAFVATSPYLVFYSQEARSYALLTLLSTTGVLCCARAIRSPAGRPLALWAAASITAIATHYFALFPWIGETVALAVFGAPRRLLARWVGAVGLASVPLLLLARHQAAAGHASWIGASSLAQRLRVTAETFSLGATFKGSLPHSVLAVCAVFALVIAATIAAAAVLLVRRATPRERRAAEIFGLIAALSIAVPLAGALGPADYFIDKNLIPFLPLLALVLAAGLVCRHAGRVGAVGAVALALAGAALTVLSFEAHSMRRPDVRQASAQLGAPVRERILVFIPRWRILLEHYQGTLEDLPRTGARVSEVDVFTTARSLPRDTVPPAFRLVRVQDGDTFTVFDFRSSVPRTVTPDHVGRRRFSESGLQPVAVVQKPR
ncbi:MAG: glycosyltransferase family 39 protein [Gaiellaceae bacterium]